METGGAALKKGASRGRLSSTTPQRSVSVMPTPVSLLAFAAASTMIVAAPGPGVLFIVGRSLALGRRGGLLTVIGNNLGALALVIVVALGAGSVVAKSPLVFTSVKLVGALYLIYLGVQAVRHRSEGLTVDGEPVGAATRPRQTVWQGFVVGVTNPKDVVFFVAVLPQFVDVHAGSVAVQMLMLGVVFVLIALLIDGSWALLADVGSSWLSSSPHRLAVVRACGGVLIVGLGVALAFTSPAS
jgi:threonine/homoserine/homoserine lactone efflux protein